VKRTPSSTFLCDIEIDVFNALLANVLLDGEDGRASGPIRPDKSEMKL